MSLLLTLTCTLLPAPALLPSAQITEPPAAILLDPSQALGRPTIPVELVPTADGGAYVLTLFPGSGSSGDTVGVIRMAPNGQVLWTREFAGQGGVQRYVPLDVVPDGAGGVFAVVQRVIGSNSGRGLLRRYSSTGAELEEVEVGQAQFPQFEPPTFPNRNSAVGLGVGRIDIGGAVALESDLNARRARIFRYQAPSGPTFELTPFGTADQEVIRLTRTIDGGYAALLRRTSGGLFLTKLDSLLLTSWEVEVAPQTPGATPVSLQQSTSGTVVLAFDGDGTAGPGGRGRLLGYEVASGALAWSTDLEAGGSPLTCGEFLPLSDGSVLVTGAMTAAGGRVAYVRRYEIDGSAGTLQVLDGPLPWRSLTGLAPSGPGWLGIASLPAGPSGGGVDRVVVVRLDELAELGAPYCGPAVTNSLGLAGRTRAFGSASVAENRLVLRASRVPAFQFGLFIVGSEQGLMPILGGSVGRLCISGSLGRFDRSIGMIGVDGTATFTVDLTAVPGPAGPTAASPGERWNFQFWYRDALPLPDSNATDAVSVLLR